MEMNMVADMKHTRRHLRGAMNREQLSGEFFLAAVIQDSLLYTLAHHADSHALMDIAHDASGLHNVTHGDVEDSVNAIASGILSAAEDLGISIDGVQTVTDYLIAHTAIPISQLQ